MRFLFVFLPVLLPACKSSVEEEDCWWCTEDTGIEDTGGSDTDGKDTDGKDTGGKDTGGKDTGGKDTGDKGETAGWSGAVDPETGTGAFLYTSEECNLSYAITEATTAEDCTSCEFAWVMVLGEVTVESDSTCKGVDGYTGAEITYGHQDPDILMGTKGGSWSAAGESYLKEGMWHFTLN